MNGEILVNDHGLEGACDSNDSLVDRLRRSKLRLESQLKEVNEALASLQSNPELTRVLHLVTKAARF